MRRSPSRTAGLATRVRLVKWLRVGMVALLVSGCDGAKSLYDAVAATGDHTKPGIPLAVLMSAAPGASASPGASTGPSPLAVFTPPPSPTQRPESPAPSPAASASAAATPTPALTATPSVAPELYDSAFFTLSYDPNRWALVEASIEQNLMGDAAYLTQKDAEGMRMAIVDDPRAKPFERIRDEATKRMARISFARDSSLSGQEAWEAFGLIGASAPIVDPDDEDEVAAPDQLDASLGKVTYYLSCTRDGRTFGLRLELDGATPTSVADQRVAFARQVAISWRWKY